MKYLVRITKDYNATLYIGKNLREVEKLATIMLDKKLPLNHGEQRLIIEKMMGNNKVLPTTTEVRNWDKDTDIIYGEAIVTTAKRQNVQTMRKNHAKQIAAIKSEYGVNVLEILVASALTAAAASLALGSMQPLTDNINANIVTISEQQDAQQAQIDNILGN